MSASSARFGFELPESTKKALEIYDGVHMLRSRTVGETINIGSGDPGFVTPEHIREAAKRAIDAGRTHYERNVALKEAIAHKLLRDNGLQIDPREGLAVTPGSHLALYDVFRAYVSAGDEVIMGNPGSYFYANTLANEGVPVQVPLRKERGFKLDPADVEARVGPRTKILAITNPDAPSGAVQDVADLERLADIAIRHDLLVVSDELYEKINYGVTEHASIGALPGMGERTLTVNGFSKAWAMTGWRVGYVAGGEHAMRPVHAVNHLNTISLNTISQYAALEALTGPQDFLRRSVEAYRERRDYVVSRVHAIDGIDCLVPEGTYYVWVDIRGLGIADERFYRCCQERHGITFNPGTAFGTEGYGFIRLSCTPSMELLEPGLDRLESAAEAAREGGCV